MRAGGIALDTLKHNGIYGGRDPAEAPAYTIADGARWLGLPTATVRAWTLGQRYVQAGQHKLFKPVVQIADADERLLSFRNLVELHVLAAIRRKHGVTLQTVRRSVDFMRRSQRVPHPLSSKLMLTDGKDLLVEHSGELLNASCEGQLEMRSVLEAYLARIEHDRAGRPARLYPFSRTHVEGAPRSIVIDPRVQFGRPVLSGTGVPTRAIAERCKAGESISAIARDFGVKGSDVEEALRYEIAA